MSQSAGFGSPVQRGAFALHAAIGRLLGVGFATQCWLISGVAAALMILASFVDGTFLLPGRSIGLFQHPAIWAFLVLQIALPLSLQRSLNRLFQSHLQLRSLRPNQQGSATVVPSPLTSFLELRDNDARVLATLFYGVGLAAFVWNTYQNQRPGIVLPYDFWDSSTFQWGFWATRVYKLYLFAWLLPYIALLHSAILVVTLRAIREARITGELGLDPFHPDGAGGLGFVPPLVTTPIIVALLVAALPMAAALEVHRAMDVTPLIGLAILLGAVSTAYVAPTLVLRNEIVAMKRDLISQLRSRQQVHYARIINDPANEPSLLPEANEAVDYYEKVCSKVNSISNYPHLRRMLSYMGLALTPSVLSVVLKLYSGASPLIGHLLRKP